MYHLLIVIIFVPFQYRCAKILAKIVKNYLFIYYLAADMSQRPDDFRRKWDRSEYERLAADRIRSLKADHDVDEGQFNLFFRILLCESPNRVHII